MTRGAFTMTAAGVAWTCPTCDTSNPLEAGVCTVCGTAFREVVAANDAGGTPARDPRVAAAAGAIFPGFGHAYIGSWGQALARVAVAMWVVATIVAGMSVRTLPSRLMSVAFILAALGLWTLSSYDAYQAASNNPGSVVLKGRTFVWLVLGLVGLLALQVVTSIASR